IVNQYAQVRLWGHWRNNGTITLNDGTLELGDTQPGDSFTLSDLGDFRRTGGIVKITGPLINTGTTLALNNATGSWYLQAGSIIGGTITTADGTRLIGFIGGDLDGVTMNGRMDLLGGFFTLEHGLNLNGEIFIDRSSTLDSI